LTLIEGQASESTLLSSFPAMVIRQWGCSSAAGLLELRETLAISSTIDISMLSFTV
jgi:hypothetical protein